MLLNLRDEARAHPAGTFQRVLAPLTTLLFAVVIGRGLYASAPSSFPEKAEGFGTAASVGTALFTRFYYPFEAISLLLIVAMVGAVVGIHVSMFWCGRRISSLIGLSRADQIAVGFSGSQKTLMIGLKVAMEYGVSILPMVSFHVGQLLVDTVIADRLRQDAERDAGK